MTSLTRGPLPARVYWTRRVAVLCVVTGLVAGGAELAQLATGSGPSEPDRAAQVAAEPTSAAPALEATPAEDATTGPDPAGKQKQRRKKRDKEPALAQPDGPCDDGDVAVTPTVDEAVGGGPITFTLELRSIESAACTWRVSPTNVTVKVTSGKDDIWSSLDCPRAVPRKNVVLRADVGTEVDVTWSARRSEEGCNTAQGEWALPGWYFVKAAALAGEPSDLHFEVTTPEPPVVTETVTPKGERKKNDGEQQGGEGPD